MAMRTTRACESYVICIDNDVFIFKGIDGTISKYRVSHKNTLLSVREIACEKPKAEDEHRNGFNVKCEWECECGPISRNDTELVGIG